MMAGAMNTVRPRTENRRSGGQDSTRNRKLQPPRKTMTGLWIVLMVLFFVEALFYAWCRVQCVNAGYGIDSENRRHQALLKERNTLKIELARLKSPERIETIARTRLGLVMPNAQQTVILP
ncbi:MAG: cell division protein FtsL [Deltaproteobacteria bacterium]|nr:cell division protein FtsL [Deltaproteobacteria bacterium]